MSWWREEHTSSLSGSLLLFSQQTPRGSVLDRLGRKRGRILHTELIGSALRDREKLGGKLRDIQLVRDRL